MSDSFITFEYRLLGRLKQDCDYYLGAGARNKKHLWALDEALQIKKMKELYEGLPVKPEWLTLEAIKEYEKKIMQAPDEQVATMGSPVSTINALLERYTEAADELQRCQRDLQPIGVATHAFVDARDALRGHPEFSGHLPKTYFSGGDLDPEGVDGHGSDGCNYSRPIM